MLSSILGGVVRDTAGKGPDVADTMMTMDVDGEDTTEREYAAMAEGLGKKLKNALSGGKGPLLKILKVRAFAMSSGELSSPPFIPRSNND